MLIVLWIALLLVAPFVSPAPAPTSTADLERLVGTWQCDGSATGNTSVETYEHGSDGTIVLHNDVRGSSGTVGTVIETFAYDAANDVWIATAPVNAFFGGFTISARRWTGASWTLEGSERVRDASRDIRIVYTQLGADTLRREHQIDVAGVWQDDANYACRRTLPDGPSASPATSSPQPHPARTPTPTSTPISMPLATPRSTAPPRDPDRARTLTGGVWMCQTIAGNHGTHVYRTLADGTIALTNRIMIGGHVYEIDERYRYDWGRRSWTNVTEKGAYRGIAAPWLGDDWTFSGVLTERGTTQPVRMVYETLGVDALRRDFQRPGPDGWVTYTSETCERK